MTSHPLPLAFGDDGLVSAVITDATTGDILMVGFMDLRAVEQTRETGYVHFWSRSRRELWKKGQTSGHLQEVQRIAVNCDLNSLLIEVNQIGAVCHDGYPTCYYRTLEPDNSMTVTRDRWFDPADVYGSGNGLAANTRKWWGAYEALRDTNFEARSGSSRLLRDAEDRVTPRIADELRELAGALDGSHRHVATTSDVALEGGQICYWIALRCVRDGMSWDEVRPDRALDASPTIEESVTDTIAALLRRQAEIWLSVPTPDLAALAHGTLAMVADACVVAGVEPPSLISADLNDMRTRAYLEPYFASLESQASRRG